jgi:hypothetical protein
MNGHAQLVFSYDLSSSEPTFLVVFEQADSDVPQKSGSRLTAVSPLFPVADQPFIPEAGESYKLVFLAHRNAFVQLGTLPASIRHYFWYSLGVAALVALVPAKVDIDALVGQLSQQEILCREIWVIENGVLQGVPRFETFCRNPAPTGEGLVAPDIGDPDLRRIVDELRLNFDSLRKRASVLMPSLATAADAMWTQITKEIETVAQEVAAATPKPGVAIEQQVDRYLLGHKRLNLSVDYIIQLNSSFAYILSQSFYGGPPLTRNLSLISSHSLLGIGTAMKALQRLTEFVIDGFSLHAVAEAVKNRYSGINVGLYLQPEGQTGEHTSTVDAFLKESSAVTQTPKLAYFSTRMGFSEQGYSVTASTQCLSSACTVRRNMLTMTHELLHAHVKGLLATILARPVGELEIDSGLLELTRDYRSAVDEVFADTDCVRSWSVLKFLRFRMFTFADGIQAIVTQFPNCTVPQQSSATIHAAPVDDDHFEADRFKNSFGFLNELVVHVLDLHYFYDASPRVYLGTLWKSWATVPGVADKIEWYILRCLAAVSVINVHGLAQNGFPKLSQQKTEQARSIDQHFVDAITALGDALDELCEEASAPPMLRVVAEKLRHPPTKQWLRYAFFPCHLFSQVVKQFLYSPALREYFDSFDDPLADRDDLGEPVFRLQPFEFPTQPIRNPIALLRGLLRRELDGDVVEDEEAASAWLFLALSSVPRADEIQT